MVGVQKAVALPLLAVLADGFRVQPKKKQSRAQTQVMNENQEVDPSELEQEKLQRFVYASRELGLSMPKGQVEASNMASCRLSESDCRIGNMNGDTLVYTDDANSRCLNGDPFAFIVRPGRTDKLHFYFPGGGACWKGSSSNAELCTQSLNEGISAAGLGGGLTADRADNPLRDYTFVAPAYCDGGAYVTNSSLDGKPQNGYLNTKYAADWAKANTDASLANFVISGSSAGALGTMAWSHQLLSDFQYSKAAVIVDSYMGVFPGGTQGPTIKNFGSCNLPIFSNFRQVCEAGQSNIQDVFDFAITSHPSVAFSMLQPKGDLVQIGFYAAIAITYGRLDIILANGLYERSNAIKEGFDNKPNFVHFIIDGGSHTFLAGGSFYSATVTGEGGGSGANMKDWVTALVDHQAVESACNGPLERNGGNAWLFKNTRYCYQELFPKQLNLR